ncbi:MAG: hypothetical protein QM446_00140 [Synergistota bacterium]|nr:hypothetical protein [Synergistota bacterium]
MVDYLREVMGMRMMRALLVCAVILAATPAWAEGEVAEDSFFAKMWSKAMPKLEQALELFEKGETLPEARVFGDDKRKNSLKYEKLLNDVFNILLDSEFHSSRGAVPAVGGRDREGRTEDGGAEKGQNRRAR